MPSAMIRVTTSRIRSHPPLNPQAVYRTDRIGYAYALGASEELEHTVGTASETLAVRWQPVVDDASLALGYRAPCPGEELQVVVERHGERIVGRAKSGGLPFPIKSVTRQRTTPQRNYCGVRVRGRQASVACQVADLRIHRTETRRRWRSAAPGAGNVAAVPTGTTGCGATGDAAGTGFAPAAVE